MRPLRAAGAIVFCSAAAGCTVLAVAGAAVSVGAAAVGTAVDVTAGAVRVTGKAIGAAADAVSGPGDGDASAAEAVPADSRATPARRP